jgi:competence protein ComEA
VNHETKTMCRKFSAVTLILFGLSLLVISDCAASQLSTGNSSASSPSSADSRASKTPKLVDINSASKAELAALPGIGQAYAQKIIDTRPHRTKRDLATRKIIPPSVYLKIQDRIIALQGSIGSARPPEKK